MLAELYAVFADADKLRTSCKTAEMIKYASNSLLATLISFSNEIGNLCAALGGIDVVDVLHGVHLDKRMSPILSDGSRLTPAFTTYLAAGCGFGGSCFPKDVKALAAHGRRAGIPMQLLESVVAVNDRQPQEIMRLLQKHFSPVTGTRAAVLGLAFKPGTDDVRESPAIPIVRALHDQGAQVNAYDPVARRAAESVLPGGVTYFDSLEAAIREVDVVIVLTRWDEFSRLPELLAGRDPQPLVVDGRRMLDKRNVLRYEGIGV
jgi:UDPglucose 6-dehydrogenase